MKNHLLIVFFLACLATVLTTCLRDELVQLEFVEVFTQTPRAIDNDITLYGTLNQIDNVIIREYGFALSATDSLPGLLNNDTLFSVSGMPLTLTFSRQLQKNALPVLAPFYYIRAYAIQELPGRERIAYSATQRLDFSLQVTIAEPIVLCFSGQAIAAAVIINRALDKPLDQHGFVYTSDNRLPELGKSLSIILGEVSAQAADPFSFQDTLRALQKDITYSIRAFAFYSNIDTIYSDTASIRLSETDSDNDGITNYCDPDDDNDGVKDEDDLNPLDPHRCGDSDGDSCDDCSIGVDGFGPLPDALPNNDGADTDGDGLCDAGDPDDDNDGVPDAQDVQPHDPKRCGDTDGDGCDDCSIGVDGFGPLPDALPNNDGADTDGDGLCDAGDPDDDNDGVPDTQDVQPQDPKRCRDTDGDGCDDCSIGVDGFGPLPDALPNNDGADTDGDGLCDAGDPDDDNDGVPDAQDVQPQDPKRCRDIDDDGCDDCAIGTDGFGPLPDYDPENDGC